MAELAAGAPGRTSFERPRVRDPRLVLAVGQQLDPEPVRVGEVHASRRARPSRRRPRRASPSASSSGQSRGELPGRVVVPGLARRRARASTARPRTRAARAPLAAAVEQAELARPAQPRLVEVVDEQADVVDAPRGGSRRARGRHALGLLLGHGERDVDRVRRHVELLAGAAQVDVPLDDACSRAARGPSISTSTTSPGSIGREFAGVPREQDVAGLERDQPAEVGELVGDREEQVVPPSSPARPRPLRYVRSVNVVGSNSAAGTTSGPSGRKPSCPFTRSIEPRSAWRKSCRPTSLAHA